MIKPESLSGTIPSSSLRPQWSKGMPIYLGLTMILAVSVVTVAYAGGGPNSGEMQVVPAQGKTDPSSSQPKPSEPKPSEPKAGQPGVQPAPAQPTSGKKRLDPLTAITFADERGTTYVIARDLGSRLELPVQLSPDQKSLMIGEKSFSKFRRTYVGDALVPIREITQFEGALNLDAATNTLTVSSPQGDFQVEVGKKRIEVDKALQQLTGYQGNVVVIQTNVSTGRPGHGTPNGNFVTGPDKERMHYSHKYNDAPMPFAIQVNGDVFLHGFTSVPHYPASHGCVRIPLGRKNPAKYLFGWAETGVETKIFGDYSWESHSHRKHRKKR